MPSVHAHAARYVRAFALALACAGLLGLFRPHEAHALTWSTIGNAPVVTNHLSMDQDVTVIGGVTYVAYADPTGAYVVKWNGAAWVPVGGSISPVMGSAGDSWYGIHIINAGGTPYVSFIQKDFEPLQDTYYYTLYSWNGASWVSRGGDSEYTDYIAHSGGLNDGPLTWDGSRVWMPYTISESLEAPYQDARAIWATNSATGGSTTVDAGAGANFYSAVSIGTTAYVSYMDYMTSPFSTMKTRHWNGASWVADTSIGGASSPPTFGQGTSFGGLYTVPTNLGTVLQLSGASWTTLSATSSTNLTQLGVFGGKLFGAWHEQQGASVGGLNIRDASLSGGVWTSEGEPLDAIVSNDSTYPVIATDPSGVRVAFSDQTSPGFAALYVKLGVTCTAPAPCTPINAWPGTWTSSLTQALSGSAFQDSDGGTHAQSQWQVRTNAGTYGTPFADSGATGTSLTSWNTTPALSEGAQYWWHVRYRDNAGNWSAYSDETSFTVDSLPPSGGTITYPDAMVQPGFAISFTPMTDSGSGIVASKTTLQYQTANWTGSSCNAFSGGWTNSFTNPTSPMQFGGTVNTCYRFRMAYTDVAGNTGYITSTAVTIVRTPVVGAATVTGFEHQAIGFGLFTNTLGSVAIDTTIKRNGAASLQVDQSGTPADAVVPGDGSGTSSTYRFAFRYSTLPTTDSVIASWGPFELNYKQSTGTISVHCLGIAGTTVTRSGAIVAGQWYTIELAASTLSANDTIDWRVDGVPQTSSSGSGASATVDALTFGSGSTGSSGVFNVDDVVILDGMGSYPIGDGKVTAYRPNKTLNHIIPGDFQYCNGAGCTLTTVPSSTETTTPPFLDDLPMNSQLDYVRQNTASTSAYLQYQFSDPVGEVTGPRAVELTTQVRAASTLTNQICAKATTNNSTTVDLYASCSTTPPSIGTTTPVYWHGTMSTNSVGTAWTLSNLTALQLRWGYSNDVSPQPILDAAIAEADIPVAYPAVAVNATPNVPTQVSPASGSSTTSAGPSLVATFTDPDATDTGTLNYEVCTVNDAPGQTCASAGGTLVAAASSAAGIANGANGLWMVAPPLSNGTYYWRVRAQDQAAATSAWTSAWQIRVGVATMTVTVDQPTLSFSATSGVNSSVQSVVTVTTDNATGYQLTTTDLSDTYELHQASADIPDWTGTDATPTTWTAGSTGASGWWGLTVVSVTGGTSTKLAKWGSGSTLTDYVNNKYAGPKSSTSITLHNRGTYFAGGDTVTVGMRAITTASTLAGTYGNTISFTAVANP